MIDLLAQWWVWMIGAIALAFLEVVAPGYVFLGFALGAGATGLVLLIGGPAAVGISASIPVLALFFAVISLVAWLLLRRWLGVREGQVKTFDRDINDD